MKYVVLLLSMFVISISAFASDRLLTKQSKHSFNETQNRFEAVLAEKGLTLFAKIDHTDGAQKVGLTMQPETVIIFGNPKGGTPFMVASPEAAIDFPLKALVWENSKGKVFVSYYSMSTLVARHHIKGQAELTKKLDGLLASIAQAATE